MRLTTSLLLVFLFMCTATVSVAQTCAERLTAAQTAYDEGQIHDLVDEFQTTWGTCLSENNLEFTKEERVAAYRLLTLTYLQLDEPEKADEYMLKLLGTDPEYLINPSVDPTEFINLYRTFRTDPIFRIGVRGGVNGNFSHMIKKINISADPNSPPGIKTSIGFQAGISMEFDLFRNKPILEDLIFNPEIMYSSKVVTDTYEDQFWRGSVTGTFSSIQLNTIAHYNLIKTRNIRAHGSLGLFGELRTKVTNQVSGELIVADGDTGGEIIDSPNLDATDAYKPFDMGLIIGGAFRFKIGRPWATIDLRYNYNFIQVVDDRFFNYKDAITYGGGIRNDQRFQTLSINAGIHFPIFKHEKLID